MNDRELTMQERRWLCDVCEPDVPDGFADRVMTAVDEPPVEVGAGAEPSRGRRYGVAATVALLAAGLALFFARVPRLSSAKTTPAASAELEAQATRLLQARCGSCHSGADKTASAAAVVAFDLSDPDWADQMSDEALRGLLERVETREDVPQSERERVRAFVSDRMQSRRG